MEVRTFWYSGVNIKYFRYLQGFSDFTALQTAFSNLPLFSLFLFVEVIFLLGSAFAEKLYFLYPSLKDCQVCSHLKKSQKATQSLLSSAGVNWAERKCYRKPSKIQGAYLCKKFAAKDNATYFLLSWWHAGTCVCNSQTC